MDHTIVGGVINSLPIEKMIAAPLTAAIQAQGAMSMQLAHFVQDVGIDSDGTVRMVTLKYNENVMNAAGVSETKERFVQAPFIALTGIPNLAIEDVNVAFELEVNTAEEEKTKNTADSQLETNYKSWWSPVTAKLTGNVTHSSEQTRKTDTRAKYSFNVSARKQATPEGLMRIIDAVTDAVAQPTELAPPKQKLIETSTPTPTPTPTA